MLLLAAAIAGCSKSSTAPASAPAPVRSVAVAVMDSAGAAVPGAYVTAFGLDNSNGADKITPVTADTAGIARFSLHDGNWCMFARKTPSTVPLYVAGSSGLVSAKPAGSVDSTQFRLVVRPESVAKGTITLNGRTDHSGTLVGVIGLPWLDITGSDGSFTIGGLPPGAWIGLAAQNGYQQAQFNIAVTAPGQTITIAPIVLMPVTTTRP
jgi:hypothetical protein